MPTKIYVARISEHVPQQNQARSPDSTYASNLALNDLCTKVHDMKIHLNKHKKSVKEMEGQHACSQQL